MNNSHRNDLVKRLTSLAVLGPVLIVIGTIGLYISTIVRNPYTILYPLVLIVSPILLYMANYGKEYKYLNQNDINGKIILLAFVILFSALILQYHSVGFRRVDNIIYLTFLLYLLSLMYILSRPHPTLGLITITIAGITNRLTAYYGSALYNGVDIYSHSRDAQSIATTGSLEALATNKYFYAPFYHLLAAEGNLIYNIPIRDVIALTTLLAVTVLPVLAVYLITVHFWSPQVGLLAGFLYIAADHTIRWSIHVSTTSLGVVFFSLLLLSLIKYVGWKDRRQCLLLIIFMSILMFTHQVSLFIGILTISLVSILTIISQMEISKPAANLGLLAGLTMYLDSVVTIYTGSDDSFFDVVLVSLFTSLITAGTEARPGATLPQDPSISPTGAAALTLLQISGSALLLTLAVVGALYWLSERQSDRELFVGIGLSGIATVLLFVTLSGPLVGLSNLMPTRWWPFTYILLAVLAAPGVLVIVKGGSEMIASITGNTSVTYTIIILFILMVPYVALMGGNYAGAYDDPLLDDAPGAERYSIQETEKEGFAHLSRYATDEQQILSDERGKSILTRYYSVNSNTISIEYENYESIRTPSILFNRKYLSTKHAQYYIRLEQDTIRVHSSFQTNKIAPEQRNTIYDNGDDQMVYLT